MKPQQKKPTVLIIGGGFAGLRFADKLSEKYFDIVLIDKHNYHQFHPLLYQVATCGLEVSAISFPFRKNFQKKKNFTFHMAKVFSIIPAEKAIETSIGKLSYDYLVVAAGTQSNFFGMNNIETSAFPMKSVTEALALRNVLLENIETALNISLPEERKPYLNIVIAGGGATGVEIAGALAEMRHYIFPKDYPLLNIDEVQIYLMEASPKLLASMSEKASSTARKYLEKMGVKVMTNTVVADYKEDVVLLKDGATIPCKTLVWTSGVKAVLFNGIPAEAMESRGRIFVDEHNKVKGCENIYAIGDICLQTEKRYTKGHPQVAQVAMQQAKNLAANFICMKKGKKLRAFSYKNKGALATVGRNKAVADLPGIGYLGGILAWLTWSLIHLLFTMGIKNKLQIMIDWMQEYFSYDASLRLIVHPKYPKAKPYCDPDCQKKEE